LLGGAVAARPASVASFELTLSCQGQTRRLRVPAPEVQIESIVGHELRFSHQGVRGRAIAVRDGDSVHIARDGAVFSFTEPSPYPALEAQADASRARAPVAGVVVQVAVTLGQRVEAGQALACVEAMKMEMWLHAAATGTVRAITVVPGQAVAAGAVIVELELAA
jgi:geranyl-CoA carboxylase alpha subunit